VAGGAVIVVGSLNADLVVRVEVLPAAGETVAGGVFERHGGGKGANQAVAAARVGARVAMVGAVGEDENGEAAIADLTAAGVDVRGVVRLGDVPTGVALIVVDERGENQIAVASGANAALDARRVAQAAAPGRGDVVLLGFEVSDEAGVAGAEAARAAGALPVLNPAPARRAPEALLAAGPLVTPNAAEARALTGEDDPERAARALAEQTGAPVLVTLGAQGALLLEDGAVCRLGAIAVDPVDTTGAGDALNGALAAELARGADLGAAARFAVAAAGLATTAAGARGGLPDRAAVEAALARAT